MDLANRGGWFAPDTGSGVNEITGNYANAPDTSSLDSIRNEYQSLGDTAGITSGDPSVFSGYDLSGGVPTNYQSYGPGLNTGFEGYDLGGGEAFSAGSPQGPDYGSGPNYVPSSSDISALYGNSGYGEGPAQQGNEFLKKYQNAVSPFQQFLKNPIVSTLMSLNPYTALTKTLLGGPQSVGGFLGSLFSSNPIGRLAGSLAGGQLANYATNGEFAPMTGGNIGGMVGGLAGGLSGLPFGSTAGSYLGRQLGGVDYNSLGGNFNSSGNMGSSGFMPGELGGMPGTLGNSPNLQPTNLNEGLSGLFNSGIMNANINRNIGSAIGQMQGLYGQNSPYATALRQQLERRDAAAGRRSQYGPREVELQAALAGNAAKLQPGLNQMYMQRYNAQDALARSLLTNFSKNPNMFSGLSGLFGGGNNGVVPVGNLPDVPNYNPVTLPDVSNGGFQSGNEGMGD
jgi:hypothetical protein